MSLVSISRKTVLACALFGTLNSLEASCDADCCDFIIDRPYNWTVSGDFLYWFPSEEVASIWADVISSSGNSARWDAVGFDFDWDTGFRVGVGGYIPCTDWDLSVYWTSFCTRATRQLTTFPGAVLRPEFFAAFLSGDTPSSITARWRLQYNTIDGEFGYKFCIGPRVSFRPFIGIKGAWIDQSIRANYENLIFDSIFVTDISAQEHLKNDFWGVGPSGGIYTNWTLFHCGCSIFEFFGDFSLASMWGCWEIDDQYENTIPRTASVTSKDLALGALTLRGFLGFGWGIDFCEGSSHFGLKVGYESQIWFNQLRIATFQLQRLRNDLTLQGLTLHGQFEF